MNDLSRSVENFSYEEVQMLMDEIEDWYAASYPELDVIYLAVPKEDSLRRKIMLKNTLEMIEKMK